MIVYSIAIIIWITWSYILASLGYDMIAEQLSIQVVIIGVAAILGYLLKSFFETKEEEKIKLEREKINSLSKEEKSEDYDKDLEQVKIMALEINKKISKYNFYEMTNRKIKYIVIHWVGAASSAKNNADYFYAADRQASAHYFVDDKEIWQSVLEKNAAWAVGGGPLDQGSPYAKYGKKYFNKCTNHKQSDN